MPLEAVRAFLLYFKHTVIGSGVYLIPRDVNRLTLILLGLTKRNLEEILLGFTVLDYCTGPKLDRDQADEIWEFGVDVDEIPIYIKLKLAEVEDVKIAKCISFHIAKYPMKFPFQNTGTAK